MLDPYYRTLLLALIAECDLVKISLYLQKVGWSTFSQPELIEKALLQLKKLTDLDARLISPEDLFS